jgi:hypothetical protein
MDNARTSLLGYKNVNIDCNVPLMKSKKGQKLCMGCNIDYAAV